MNNSLKHFTENEYLALRQRRWKASTAANTGWLIRVHLLDEMGRTAIEAITRKDLQSLLDRKSAEGLSYSVVASLRWQMRAIFRMAKNDGLISLGPAEELFVAALKSTADKRVILPSQIAQAQALLGLRDRIVFRLAVCEGMRPGEIAGLRVSDYVDGCLFIRRRVYRGKVDTPKSLKSKRCVPVTAGTKILLDRHVALVGVEPHSWMFSSEVSSSPISYANLLRRKIHPALKTIGLGDVNFQVLRRTWVTEFSQIETDPHVRAQIAGHSVDVHQNEYRQGKIDVLRQSMSRLGEHLK